MNGEWLCGGCQKRFKTEARLLEHQFLKTACQRLNYKKGYMNSVEQSEIEQSERKEREFQELLEEDRIKNPTLALISDHLWWLAFLAKLGLISMLISVGLSLIFMGG